jgi:hypothetical protein
LKYVRVEVDAPLAGAAVPQLDGHFTMLSTRIAITHGLIIVTSDADGKYYRNHLDMRENIPGVAGDVRLSRVV